MSTTRTVRIGLALAAAVVLLGACETVKPSDLARVEDEVSSLRARVEAAEAKAAQAEAAAMQCTQTCQAVSERTERMFQQSMRK